MSEVQSKYSPLNIVKDESFDIDNISEYNLCLTLDLYTLTLGVIDTRDQRWLQLESYLFEEATDSAVEALRKQLRKVKTKA